MRTLSVQDNTGKSIDLKDLNLKLAHRLWGQQAVHWINERDEFLFDWVTSFLTLGKEDLAEVLEEWRKREKEFEETHYEVYSGLKRITVWMHYQGYTLSIRNSPSQ